MNGLVDVETAALAAGVTARAIRGRIQDGHLPATRIGRRWYVTLEDVEASGTSARAAQLRLTRHTQHAA